MADNKATKAAKKNKGLLGGAARALSGRKNRLDQILSNATTPDVREPVGKNGRD